MIRNTKDIELTYLQQQTITNINWRILNTDKGHHNQIKCTQKDNNVCINEKAKGKYVREEMKFRGRDTI